MLRNVILKHFLRLVYMRKFLIYIFLLVLPVICKAQEHEYPIIIEKSTLDLKKPKIGQFIRFGVYYNLDNGNILEECYSTLDSLIRLIQTNPNITWEISSYTDCRASKEYNLDLTDRRSKMLYNYFASKGVDIERIKPVGYGESQLLNNCLCDRMDGDLGITCTEEQHQENRRTELKIIAIKVDKKDEKCFNGFSYPEDSTFTYLKHLASSENQCPEVFFFYWQNPDAYSHTIDWKVIFIGDKNNVEYSYSQWDTSKPVLLRTKTINRYRKVLTSIKNEPRCSDAAGDKSFLMIIHIKDGVYTCYNANHSIQIDEQVLLDYIFKDFY